MANMLRNYKLSIVIPTHNRIDLFIRTFDSVRRQTRINTEIIISDDSSDVNAQEIIKEKCSLLQKDGFVAKYLFSEPSLGQPRNTNRGINESSGDIIRILHSDDIIHPNTLEFEIDLFNKFDCDVAYHDVIPFSSESELRLKDVNNLLFIHPRYLISKWLHSNTALPSGLIFTRKILKRVGSMNEDLVSLCDWDLFFRLTMDQLDHNKMMMSIGRGYVGWRLHKESATGMLYEYHYKDHIQICSNAISQLKSADMTPDEIDEWNRSAKQYRENRYELDTKRFS